MGIGQLTRIIRRLFEFDGGVVARQAIEDDRAFVAYHIVDLAAGSTANIALTNPTTDRSIDITGIDYTAVFDGQFSIYDTFSTVPSGGTTLSPDSLLVDTTGTQTDTAMTVVSNATFTSDGDPHFARPTTATGQGNDPATSRGTFADPIVEPGRSVAIELDNQDSAGGIAAIGVKYAELDRVPSRR